MRLLAGGGEVRQEKWNLGSEEVVDVGQCSGGSEFAGERVGSKRDRRRVRDRDFSEQAGRSKRRMEKIKEMQVREEGYGSGG